MGKVESENPVLVEPEPPLGWIVINRPHVRNALNLRAWQGIVAAMSQLQADSAIRVIIMRGVTPQAFISGADISEFPTLRDDADKARAYSQAPGQVMNALGHSPKPVIAMLAGLCIGGGMQVATACDMRIGARGTKFGIPAARLGLAYPLDATLGLAQIVGPAHARDILISARIFDADEAYRMGYLTRLVEPEQLESAVREYALKTASNAPLTMATAKAAIREGLKAAAERDAQTIAGMVGQCNNSEDYREGVRAFMEKRAPRFQGR